MVLINFKILDFQLLESTSHQNHIFQMISVYIYTQNIQEESQLINARQLSKLEYLDKKHQLQAKQGSG